MCYATIQTKIRRKLKSKEDSKDLVIGTLYSTGLKLTEQLGNDLKLHESYENTNNSSLEGVVGSIVLQAAFKRSIVRNMRMRVSPLRRVIVRKRCVFQIKGPF